MVDDDKYSNDAGVGIDESGFDEEWDDAVDDEFDDTAHDYDDEATDGGYDTAVAASPLALWQARLQDAFYGFLANKNAVITAAVVVVVLILFFIIRSGSSEPEYPDLELLVESTPRIATEDFNRDRPAPAQEAQPLPSVSPVALDTPPAASALEPSVSDSQEMLTSVLLQNYPTRDELSEQLQQAQGDSATQAELDAAVISLRREMQQTRAAIARQMAAEQNKAANNEPSAEMLSAIADVKNNMQILQEGLELQKQSLDGMKGQLASLEKNSGWYHNRIRRLEKQTENSGSTASTSQSTAKAPAKAVETPGRWLINGASARVAFIEHSTKGDRLRVTKGVDIPGCGKVRSINPDKQQVKTAKCVITR